MHQADPWSRAPDSGFAVDVSHRQEEMVIEQTCRIDGHQIRMFDRCRATRLSFKTPAEVRLISELREYDLQRQPAAEASVFSEVDGPHPSATEKTDDAKIAQAISRLELVSTQDHLDAVPSAAVLLSQHRDDSSMRFALGANRVVGLDHDPESGIGVFGQRLEPRCPEH